MAVLMLLVACGGGAASSNPLSSGGSNPSSQAAAVNVTITDAPPAGVAIVSFEVTVNSAVLQPGNVALLSKQQRIELTKLQAHTAFLDSKNVPAGTYTSFDVTFSNPEITITNNTGAAIGSCAIGATCEIKPPLANGLFSYNSAPFPVTVSASSPFGLLVDFDLANSISSTLGLTPVVKITQVTGKNGGPPTQDIDDVMGKVTAKDTTANTITIQGGGSDGKQFTFTVDANTAYKHFDDAGLQNAFAGVAVGQVLKADLQLGTAGALLATVVELHASTQEQMGELQGTIVSLDSPTQFKMVVHQESPEIANADVGNIVTVTILPSTKLFTKDDLHLTIPAGVQFFTSADMMVGQRVRVKPASAVTGTPLATTASDIRLTTSSLTARIVSVSGLDITVDTLPAVFTSSNPSVTSMVVKTSSLTKFENVTGPSALVAGDQISVEGLIFKGTPPVVAARNVRKR
jgi:hypothetical protein